MLVITRAVNEKMGYDVEGYIRITDPRLSGNRNKSRDM